MPENNKKHRMGIGTLIVLGGIALVLDLVGLIPGAEDVVGTIFWGVAAIYFWIAGMGVFNGRRLATMLSSWIIGLIPFLQWLPQLTLGIVAIFFMLRTEEKTGMPISSIAGGKKVTSIGGAPMRLPEKTSPLNVDGVRAPGGGLAPSK